MKAISITRGACILISLLSLPSVAGAAGGDAVISEIMFNPDGDENAREYVEILNLSESPLMLDTYTIGDGEGFDGIVPVTAGMDAVPPGGYGLIIDPDYFDGEDIYDIPAEAVLFTVTDRAIGSRGLSNSAAEQVSLISADSDTVSQVTYDISCPAGHSWERILPDGSDNPSNFRASIAAGGTPGRENSVLPPLRDAALDSLSMTVISLPAYGEPLTVALTCTNAGREPLDGVTMAVFAGISTASHVDDPAATVTFAGPIPPGEKAVAETVRIDPLPGGLATLTAIIASDPLPAANDTLTIRIETPIPDGILVLNEIMASPSAGDAEWAEVLNTGGIPVSLAGWQIGDSGGSYSEPLTPARPLGAGCYAILAGSGSMSGAPDGTLTLTVQSFPTLNNDGDTVVIMDWTGTIADSMKYADCEAGISLELISTPSTGTVTGWDYCVDDSGSTPGRRNSIAYPPLGVEDNGTVHLGLTITPNPFEFHTTVAYQLPFPLARVRLRVYDRRGRQVVTLRDTHESGSEWTGEWDGRDDSGAGLPAGPYIMHLEALDKQSGTVHTVREMVVIGARL